MPGTRIDCTRRGDHHGRAFASTARLRAALLAFALLLLAPAVRAQDDPFVQRGVPAEATAENAVVARDRALAAGQRLAYERMAAQTGMSAGASDSQIQSMVQSLVIESERITPRGYSARITVNFRRTGGGRAPEGTAGGSATGSAPSARRGAAVATVDVVARYRSFPEWVEINRRLSSAAPVARMEVVSISGDTARLRLALRAPPFEAAADLAESGIDMVEGPPDPRSGEGWRLGLAGWR